MREIATFLLSELSDNVTAFEMAQLEEVLTKIKSAKRVFLVGAGRSRLILSLYCVRLRHLGISAFMIGDPFTPPVSAGDILLAASGSGTTTSTVALSTQFKVYGGEIIVFTSDNKSKLAMLGDVVVTIDGSTALQFDQGSQIMRSLFEQTLFILLETLAHKHVGSLDSALVTAAHANVE
ncbi:MAG TPA: SIS domain-containing protein [Sphaerochaeta sp.]|nr:SIS domain-containing protein [Sphaerochaeta sp.]